MASKDRKYRLWYVPHDMSFRQRRRRFWDRFGEYQVVRANYNVKNDWYCKHSYFNYPDAESYHYINVTGWYYSMNPDGSEETLHMKKKEALFGPPDSDTWENWSNVVPWDELPAIPDRCIERFNCPGPLIWSEIDRREREQVTISRKVEEPEKEPEEHGELKKQKKRKSEQAGEHRAKKMRTGEEEIERPDEQESREKPEERKIGNKELEEKLRRKLEQKLKRKLGTKIEEKLRRKLEQKLERKLGVKLEEKLEEKLERKLKKKLEKRLEKQKQREAQGEAS
ncbi:Pc16g06190 [Penicillium rubens Wisconsin 54-1255]|uniref:Pc16g06190 protein n=1 Tax=Penicillium rubens (strain ATCC 28089 / DSM 1075 / NRRL 1951 / Wisconsin 54-1255) TaxID=500485 RepID=B6H8T5_PENRW|nr:Pc16g06190 [Penicillium rubens Wisconsin 54-1255]